MSRSLVDHTRLDRIEPGVYARVNEREWWGRESLFGGFVMALCAEAMRLEVADDTYRLRTFTHQFARRFPDGPCRIEANVEREGRRSRSVTARLFAEGRLCGLSLGSFHIDYEGLTFDDVPHPGVAPIAGGEASVEFPFEAPCHDRALLYPRFGLAVGDDPKVTGGWIEMHDPAPVDERVLLALSDMWIPAAINHPERATAMVSFEQSAIIDARGVSDGPLLLRAEHGQARRGLVDEDIDIWDRTGQLVLRARQARILP